MTKFKINKNKPLPTEDLINKHKDFNKLIAHHQKITNYKNATRPLYKNPRFMGLIIVLGIVLLTILIIEKDSDKNKTKEKEEIENAKKDSANVNSIDSTLLKKD